MITLAITYIATVFIAFQVILFVSMRKWIEKDLYLRSVDIEVLFNEQEEEKEEENGHK